MTPLSASAPAVIRRRPWTGQVGTCLFFVLVLLICVERRVAELDLEPDDGVLLENDDGLDGAEILDRLVGLDDIQLPQPPDLGRVAVGYITSPSVEPVREVRIFTRTPRAPPSVRVPG